MNANAFERERERSHLRRQGVHQVESDVLLRERINPWREPSDLVGVGAWDIVGPELDLHEFDGAWRDDSEGHPAPLLGSEQIGQRRELPTGVLEEGRHAVGTGVGIGSDRRLDLDASRLDDVRLGPWVLVVLCDASAHPLVLFNAPRTCKMPELDGVETNGSTVLEHAVDAGSLEEPVAQLRVRQAPDEDAAFGEGGHRSGAVRSRKRGGGDPSWLAVPAGSQGLSGAFEIERFAKAGDGDVRPCFTR